MTSYGFIIPSKNRPAQLYTLLYTLIKFVTPHSPVLIIWKGTDEQFRQAYHELINEWPMFMYLEEKNFREQWIAVFRNLDVDRMIMLVDDDLFLRDCPLSIFDDYHLVEWVPSLRLSLSKNLCYTQARLQSFPNLHRCGELLEWSYTGADCDWGWPLSCDGNIYDRAEMLAIFEHMNFLSSNSPELALQSYKNQFILRRGVCFTEERLVCIQANTVQTEYPSKSKGPSTFELLKIWQEGMRIRHEDFEGKTFSSVHIETPFTYCKRETKQ